MTNWDRQPTVWNVGEYLRAHYVIEFKEACKLAMKAHERIRTAQRVDETLTQVAEEIATGAKLDKRG